MHRFPRSSTAWLSLTPEPECTLPALVARLDGADGERFDWAVSAEEEQVSELILHGTGPRWLRYLQRAADLAVEVADGTRTGDDELALTVAEVVLYHDQMLIGLPGDAYARTSERRRRLEAACAALRRRMEAPA
jgi:hypothetical protein